MASPAARMLLTSGAEPGGVFALFGRVGRSPRVYAAQDREAVVRQIQATALAKMGITLAGKNVQSASSHRVVSGNINRMEHKQSAGRRLGHALISGFIQGNCPAHLLDAQWKITGLFFNQDSNLLGATRK